MSEYPCGAQREQDLMLYVGGELLPWERLRMESHLRSCPLCREQQRVLQSTMHLVAAELRGGGLPAWESPGTMVTGSGVSSRLQGRPVSGSRLATLAAVSVTVAVFTSYMAANFGDHLKISRSAPLSRVSIAASPPCKTGVGTPARSCRNCASPAPDVTAK